jgi:hypothetical protein
VAEHQAQELVAIGCEAGEVQVVIIGVCAVGQQQLDDRPPREPTTVAAASLVRLPFSTSGTRGCLITRAALT